MRPKIAGIVGLIAIAGALAGFIYTSTSDVGINPLYWLLAVGVGYLIYRRDIPLTALQRIRRKPTAPEDTSVIDSFEKNNDSGAY